MGTMERVSFSQMERKTSGTEVQKRMFVYCKVREVRELWILVNV